MVGVSRWATGLERSEVPPDVVGLTNHPYVMLAIVCKDCGIPCRPNGSCDFCHRLGAAIVRVIPPPRVPKPPRPRDPKLVLRDEAMDRHCPQCGALPGTACVALLGKVPGVELVIPHSQRFDVNEDPVPAWYPRWDPGKGKTRQDDVRLRRWLAQHGTFLAPRNWSRSTDEQ